MTLGSINGRSRQTAFVHLEEMHQVIAITCNALALLIDGVMRGGWCIDRAAELGRLLVGCRLYELNGRLEDSELQGHSHFWGKRRNRFMLKGLPHILYHLPMLPFHIS